MATSTLIPVGDYLCASYHPDCEWIDGEVKERNMGEGSHANVQGFFVRFLGNHAKEWGIRVWPEQRVQVAPTRYRVPDVCVTRRGAAFEQIVRTPPLLCIEVLSPEDRMTDMYEKVDDYLGMGVACIWVVDPRRRKAFRTHGASLQPVNELDLPGTEIRVNVTEVFAELDELEGLVEN